MTEGVCRRIRASHNISSLLSPPQASFCPKYAHASWGDLTPTENRSQINWMARIDRLFHLASLLCRGRVAAAELTGLWAAEVIAEYKGLTGDDRERESGWTFPAGRRSTSSEMLLCLFLFSRRGCRKESPAKWKTRGQRRQKFSDYIAADWILKTLDVRKHPGLFHHLNTPRMKTLYNTMWQCLIYTVS